MQIPLSAVSGAMEGSGIFSPHRLAREKHTYTHEINARWVLSSEYSFLWDFGDLKGKVDPSLQTNAPGSLAPCSVGLCQDLSLLVPPLRNGLCLSP